MVLWTPPPSLICVSSYAITLCPKEAKCQDPVFQEAEGGSNDDTYNDSDYALENLHIVILVHSGETVMFFARGLAPCSNYTLHIVPQFGELSFEAISAKASTHLGDCEKEDLLEDDVEDVSSTTPHTTVNIQQQHNFQTKGRSSSTSSPVLFLSEPIMWISIVLLFCFSEYI